MTSVTRIISDVCKDLEIDCKSIDEEGVFLELKLGSKKMHVVNTSLGLTSLTDGKIALDKWYQYLLLHKKVQMPRLKFYLDPKSEYGEMAKFKTRGVITEDILREFDLPVIVKKNRGSLGVHVFKVDNLSQLEKSVDKIFDQKNKEYDYGLVVQDYVKSRKEYRAVIYKGKIMLAYYKDTNGAKYVGNLSPLHWEGAKAVLASNEDVVKLGKIVKNMYKIWSIKYAGLDIIENEKGELFLIEVNSAPGLAYFIDNNGEKVVVKMYREILGEWKRNV